MIDGLKPYPKMKDSGVPWLGKLPAGWEVRKLRGILRRVTKRNRPDLPLLSVVRERGVVRRNATPEDENHNYIPDDLSNYKVVLPGQFAMNKMKAWQGSYGVSQYEGIVSPAYFVFDLAGVEGRFFHVAIRSHAYVPSFAQASDGVRIGQWDLAEPRMREIPFAIPPLPEQAAIVRFLDHADRRIRRYIRAKQKLIKLLEEQKQAIIHRAVTRGLDPNVRLKPSGVEWLGDVPEHWEVRRVLSCLEGTRAGIWGDDPTPANEADHVTCLRVADFDMSRLSIHGSKLTKRAVPASLRNPRLLAAGDILMEKSGGGETEPVGRVVLYDENVAPHAICSNFIVRLRPNATTEPKFLLHVLAIMQVTRRNVPCIKQTTGIQNLDERAYLSLAIGVPPLVEQQAIIASLTNRLRPIDKAASRARREIDLLREYRTRLIADVVTGKLDVREAAARLPDEIEEPEPLDETEAEGDADDAGVGDADEMIEEAET